MLDACQVEVKRPVTSCRAPGIFHLADPQSSQIPLELQADTIGLPLHGDLQHVRSVGLDRANAMPNVCGVSGDSQLPAPPRGIWRGRLRWWCEGQAFSANGLPAANRLAPRVSALGG